MAVTVAFDELFVGVQFTELPVVALSVPREAIQFTPVLVVPVTVATRVRPPSRGTLALRGDKVRATVEGTFTVAALDLLESAWLVARTVYVPNWAGAVQVTLLPVVALRDPPVAVQFTAVFAVPPTATLKAWVPPEATVALAGVTLTVTIVATVMVAVALLLGSAWLVAVRV